MNEKLPWLGYACAPAAAMLCTLLGLAMTPRFDVINIAMVYLLAVDAEPLAERKVNVP